MFPTARAGALAGQARRLPYVELASVYGNEQIPNERETADPTMSRQDLRDHFAMDVGEAPVGAVVTEGEFLVIDSQQVQHRGMEIVSGRGRRCGFPGPLIAFAPSHAAFSATAGHPADERA